MGQRVFGDEGMPGLAVIDGSMLRKLGLLAAGVFAAFIIAEGALRLLLDPVDYLQLNLVPDDRLGHRIAPNSAGHDAWGFRNREVPEHVEIVALGDSLTYGNNAPAKGSWPAILARETGWSVYNMGLGGYGPVQYYELARTRAEELGPAWIIVGLFVGNDVVDASAWAYSLEPWFYLRDPGHDLGADKQPSRKDLIPEVLWAGPRQWLASHVVLYRFSVYSIGSGYHRMRMRKTKAHPSVLVMNERPYPLVLTNLRTFRSLNPEHPQFREGVRLTKLLLSKIDEAAESQGAEFLVCFVPTRELVYRNELQASSRSDLRASIMGAIDVEEETFSELKLALETEGIRYLDSTEALRAAATKRQLYLLSLDDHPTKHGYHAIAGAIADYLAALPE